MSGSNDESFWVQRAGTQSCCPAQVYEGGSVVVVEGDTRPITALPKGARIVGEFEGSEVVLYAEKRKRAPALEEAVPVSIVADRGSARRGLLREFTRSYRTAARRVGPALHILWASALGIAGLFMLVLTLSTIVQAPATSAAALDATLDAIELAQTPTPTELPYWTPVPTPIPLTPTPSPRWILTINGSEPLYCGGFEVRHEKRRDIYTGIEFNAFGGLVLTECQNTVTPTRFLTWTEVQSYTFYELTE